MRLLTVLSQTTILLVGAVGAGVLILALADDHVIRFDFIHYRRFCAMFPARGNDPQHDTNRYREP